MNFYCIITGEYSDRDESWYSHPEKMTQKEFGSLLWNIWKNVTRPNRELTYNESNSVCLETFGVSVKQIPSWVLFHAERGTLSAELFKGVVSKGNAQQLSDFCKKYSGSLLDLTELLMRDAGFTPVLAEACIHLTPHYRQDDLDDFEKDMLHEVEDSI